MKASVIYFSVSGTTEKMAQKIVEGLEGEGVEAQAFSIDAVDEDWVKQSDGVLIGSPTYYADLAAKMKVFLETLPKYGVSGKLGGAFATAGFIHGGGEAAIESIHRHMLVCGMLVYSGGGAYGQPVIHLGPVATGDSEDFGNLFMTFGSRFAKELKVLKG